MWNLGTEGRVFEGGFGPDDREFYNVAPYTKMGEILIFYVVCIQISLTSLALEFKYQKKASEANLNTDERILKCQPFLH